MNPNQSQPNQPLNPFQNMINTVKQDPNSDYAKAVFDNIRGGKFNDLAKQYGYDLTPFNTPKPQPQPQAQEQGFAQRVGADYAQAGKDIQTSVERGSELMSRGGLGILEGAARAGTGVAGAFARAVFSPLTEIIAPLIQNAKPTEVPGLLPTIMKNPQVQNFIQSLGALASQHPDLAQGLKDSFDITLGVGGQGFLEQDVKKLVENGISAASNALESGKNAISSGVENAKNLVKGAPETAPELVGKITQAKPEQLGFATKALQGIDTTGVKTFEDLSGRLDSQIKTNLKAVDAEFAKNPKNYSINELTQRTPSGKFGINYPKQAISDLKDLYTETKNITGKERLIELENKMKTEGLTAKEINDLAKEYGTRYNAFKANNQIKAGKVAAGAENVRSGLKDTARGLLGTDEARNLDKITGNMINTKELTDSMATKVQQLENKFQKAGILQKAGGALGKAIDISTGGLFKGLLKTLTGGSMEGKTLNPIELEKMLESNLSKLDKLNAMNPKDALQEIQNMQSPPPPKAEGEIPKTMPTETINKTTEPLAGETPSQFAERRMKMLADERNNLNLLSEAKNYKTAEDFVKAQESAYRGVHEAPTRFDGESVAPAYALDKLYPKDIYSNKATQYYSSGQPYDAETINLLQGLKDKPNAKVTVYRAVPGTKTNAEMIAGYERQKVSILKNGKIPDAEMARKYHLTDKSAYYDFIDNEIQRLKGASEPKVEKYSINEGDWVTPNRKYAVDHGESNLGGNYKILSKTVRADELFTDANSIQEFGYSPRESNTPTKSQLTDIWNQANKGKK